MTWLAKHKLLLLVGVLLVGAFLRLYRIEETLMFQGDQGRDAIVAKQLIKDGNLVLLGPAMSVGDMFLGPFYYYFMAPFLAISFPNPVGPAYGVALVSILTLVLIYAWGKEVFGRAAALVATFLYGFNLIVIEHSRFSWNPNIAPFFALVIFWACYRALSNKDYRYFLLAAVSFGLLTQTHYVSLLMGGVLAFSVMWSLILDRSEWKKIILYGLLSLGIYIVSWAPLIVFNARHNNLIVQGFLDFFQGQASDGFSVNRIGRMIRDTEGRSFRILAQMNQSPNGVIDRIVVFGSVLLLGGLVYFKKLNLRNNIGLVLVLVWLATGIVGTTLYSDTIFDHYLLYLAPGVALFFGVLLGQGLWSVKMVGKIAVVAVLGVYLYGNLPNIAAFRADNGPSANHFGSLVEEIKPVIPEGRYNLALITESKDYRGMNYRYWLEASEHTPEHFENYDNLDWLLIIDELRVEDPFSWQIYEIQRPGLTVVQDVLELENGPRVYLVGPEEK